MPTRLTQLNSAIFVQDGSSPLAKPKSAGIEGQLLALDGITMATGDVAPVFEYDPARYKAYKAVATTVSPPGDFDTFDVMYRQDVGSIPKSLMRPNCPQTFYKIHGDCADPTNFLRGWNSYVLVLPDTVTSGDLTTAGKSFDGDDINEDSQSRKARRPMFPVGSIIFGSDSLASSDQYASVTYGRRSTDCVTCEGTPEVNDIYALVQGDGVATPARVRYSTDGGNSFANVAITGITNAEMPFAILATPEYLVVVSDIAGGATLSGYYVSAINQLTGVPSSTWTKVTTGFVATAIAYYATITAGNDIYIGADLGYIYKITNPLAGAEVSRQGAVGGDTIAAIAASSEDPRTVVARTATDVLITINSGTIWSFAPTVPTLLSGPIAAVDRNTIYTHNGSDTLFATINGGASWFEVAVPVAAFIVSTILIVNPNVIYMVGTDDNTTEFVLMSSWDYGYSWAVADPRLFNLPTFQSGGALAAPFKGSDGVRANHLLVGGYNSDASAGLLAIGVGNVI